MRLRIEICVGDHTNGEISIVMITSLNFKRTPRQLCKKSGREAARKAPTQ